MVESDLSERLPHTHEAESRSRGRATRGRSTPSSSHTSSGSAAPSSTQIRCDTCMWWWRGVGVATR
eukprot:53052-Eustigmatos_ZCMA.PRE.1